MVVHGFLTCKGVLQECKTDGQYPALLTLSDDFGPEVGIPAISKGNQDNGKQGRLTHGSQNLGNNSHSSQTVHSGRLNIAVINGHKILPQHENEIGRNCYGKNQSHKGIRHSPVCHHNKNGDKGNLNGDHQRSQHDDKTQALAFKFSFGESIACKYSGYNLGNQDPCSHNDGVVVILGKVAAV